jgi:anti-sigma28 factor (negative regulator of flagellin synthesis)
MNNKYIFSFVFLVILTAVSLLLFNIQTPNSEDLYQGSDEQVSVKTTTTLAPTTTTTLAPTTTTTLAPTTTTTLAPTTTTTTTVPVNISEDEESLQIVEDEDVDEQLLYDGPYLSFAGFEGSNQRLLDELVAALPEELKGVVKNKILFINGCHQYALSVVSRCPYGVWDSSGTYPDGTKGAEWTLSIWISDRAFTAGEQRDVLIHESAHALSYLTRNCNTENNASFRKDAWDYFGSEEQFADALVLYFGGSYNHYRLSGDLTDEETNYISNYIATCSEG